MKNHIIFWVLKKIKRRIPAILLMTVAHVGNSLLGVYFALNTRNVIDTATSGNKDAFYSAVIIQLLIILGILLCITVFRILREKLVAKLDRDWKNELLHNLLHGEYASVSSYHSGELINRMTNDVRVIDDGLVAIVPSLAAMSTKLIAVAVVLIAMEPRFGILIVLAGVIVMLATSVMRKHLKALNKRVSECDGKVAGMLQETLEKLLVVQAMDVSEEMEKRADHMMGERFSIQMRRKNVSLFANSTVSVLMYGASFGALVYGAIGLLGGTMTFGQMTALSQLVGQIQTPFVNMSGIYPQYIALLASAERLKELCDLHEEVSGENLDVAEEYHKMQVLKAEGVFFTYDRSQVLQGAEFEMKKGSFGVITGASGIGKSTILKLLLGIYKPDEGTFYLEKEDGKLTLDRSTRKLFAYVPQGNLLLSGTLRDNLILTKPDATEEEIAHAVSVSAMDEYLSELPQGLDTVIRENAGGLSEGQAQRLAVARAILSGAPILLMDEATSALDEETEKKVLNNIKALNNRTCIIVTHRKAAIDLCDWQLEMEQGPEKVTYRVILK